MHTLWFHLFSNFAERKITGILPVNFFIMQDVFILLNIVTYSASQCHCLPMLDVKLIDSLQSLVWQLCEFCTMKNWVWSIYFSCIQESIKTSKFLAFSYILCLIGTCIYVHEYDKAKEV